MTLLTIWADDQPSTPTLQTPDREVIAAELAAVGVTYRAFTPVAGVDASATSDDVIAAHQGLVDALIAEHGYTLIDVAQIHPEDSDEWRATAAGARAKFLNEHTHDEEEIRYFSSGRGVFYLHMDGRVLAMLCTAGDLISVPELTTHWFDMGTMPDFTAIRFFRTDDGWVGSFTGSDISTRFADADRLMADAESYV
jgi:1,2-dihydroxy-3-keto-5-methylthiopentene dioxygenase